MNDNYENIKNRVGAFSEVNLFDEAKSQDAFHILRPKSHMSFREYLLVMNNEFNRPKWQNNFNKNNPDGKTTIFKKNKNHPSNK